MPIVNYATREVHLKIVLHGPPSSGRATTLAKLHASNQGRASLSGLAIPAKEFGEALSFSFLADAPNSFGFGTRFEFHTLSGPLSSGRSLQLLLRDADGIVLVADSQWEKLEDNVKSLQEIEENLKKEDAALEDVPCVLQYNKRDLPDIAPANYIDFLLNNRPNPAPVFETVATTGENLPAMQQALMERVLERLAESYPQEPAAVAEPVAASEG